MMSNVEGWLQTFLCSQYARIFEAYGYKSLHSVCNLQLPHLLAMGVPRNHSEKILENLRNLRQTMYGYTHKSADSDFYHCNKYNPSLNPAVCALKTVAMNANYRGMNQYPDEYSGYGQSGNSMQPVGFPQGSYENANMAMMNAMGGGGGYAMSSYDSNQSHMMMASQGQMSAHAAVYQQHTQQAFVAQQQQHQQQQYYNNSSSSGGSGSTGTPYSNQPYPVQGGSMAAMGGNSPYYNAGGTQTQATAGSRMVPPPHHHLRNTSGQQNPQQVADNILQMASSFPSHHTVQVPLKNRHAPYQIPRSPQNYYSEKSMNQQQNLIGQGSQQTLHNPQSMHGQQGVSGGQMQTKASQAHGQIGQSSNVNQSPAMMYAGSSPHHQMPRGSPTSPMMMPSPNAAHQSQSLSSPGALHSPSSATVCSPVSSPVLAGMRSPSSMPMRSPSHMPSGYSGQPINSPQRSFAASDSSCGIQHCSPTSMHSPASHCSSPYASTSMSHFVNSPPQTQNYSTSANQSYKMNTLMDSGQGPGGHRVQGMQDKRSDPLQSLQKLVMLPETQVVDPKSVVSDGCLQNCDDGSKNSEGPAGQSREAVDCSAGVSVSCNPPTSGVSCTAADCLEKPNSDTVSTTVGQFSPNSVSQSQNDEITGSPAIDNSVEDKKISACESQSCMQSVISATNDPSTHSFTSEIKSDEKLGIHCCSSISKKETGLNSSEVAQSDSSGRSDDDTKNSVVSQKQDLSFRVHYNGPVLSSKSVDKMDKQSCADGMNSEEKSGEEVKTDTAEDDNVRQLDNAFGCNGSSCTLSNACKASTPQKCNSPRLPLNSVSDMTDSSPVEASSISQNLCENNHTPVKNKVQASDNSKPSPPNKHLELTGPKSIMNTSRVLKSATVTDNVNKCNKEPKQEIQSTDIIFKRTLVNGIAGKHTCDIESGAVEKLHPKNNIQQNSAKNQLTGTNVLTPEHMSGKNLDIEDGPREVLTVHGASAFSSVNHNGPENSGLLVHDVMNKGNSGKTDITQGSISNPPSKTQTTGVSSHSNDNDAAVSSNDVANQNLLFDDEDDSFCNELDFGYDSPPVEMEADDNWKPDFEKRTFTNGVDEADGSWDCAENNSDKSRDPACKGTTGPGDVEVTPFVRTRSITRSISGKGVKRKLEQNTTTTKRTRRSSSFTEQQSMLPLSMECDEIDTKESSFDVEVVSSSDESFVKNKPNRNKKRDNKNQDVSQALTVKSSPVVVLTKSPSKSKRDRKISESDKLVNSKLLRPNSSPKSAGKCYSVRGEGGRFISRKISNSSSTEMSVTVDTCSDNDKSVSAVHHQDNKEDGSGIVSGIETETADSSLRQHVSNPVTKALDVETPINSKKAKSQIHLKAHCAALVGCSSVNESASSVNESCAESSACMSNKKGEPKKEGARSATTKKTKKRLKKNKGKTQCMQIESADVSLKDMKFGSTLKHLQRNKNGSKSQPSKQFSPFVRIQRKNSSSSVLVFNHPPADGKDVATTSIQITNFSPDKSVMVPYTKTNETPWVCAVCGKRSSYRFLGDLFGPYFLESQLPLVNRQVEGSKKDSKHESANVSEVQNPHNTRRKSLSNHRTSSADETVPPIPQEVWIHEDCAMWSSGVYLVGSSLYGLEEAVKATSTTTCAGCQEKGASIGCLHKGCNQSFHYICAVDGKCFLDVENFSMLCPKHKEKKLKGVTASTSKS